MLVVVHEDYDAMSKKGAEIIASRIRRKPNLALSFTVFSVKVFILVREPREDPGSLKAM